VVASPELIVDRIISSAKLRRNKNHEGHEDDEGTKEINKTSLAPRSLRAPILGIHFELFFAYFASLRENFLRVLRVLCGDIEVFMLSKFAHTDDHPGLSELDL